MTQKPGKPAPWFKFWMNELLASTAGLTAAEFGVYMRLVTHMFLRGEPIADDASRLARLCGTTTTAFTRTLELLVERGLVEHKGHGKLWAAYAEQGLRDQQERKLAASRSASVRWQKDEQKQHPEDANAMLVRGIESEGRADGPPALSASSPSPSNPTVDLDQHPTVDGSSAPDGAPPVPDDDNDDCPF